MFCQTRRKRPPLYRSVVLIAFGLVIAGCGGGSNTRAGSAGTTPTVASVAVSCMSSTVSVGQTIQCNARLQGSGNLSQAVTWSVNGVAGGSDAVGTISTSGLYTAPANVPSPASVAVTAMSQADSSISGSASLTVKLSISISAQSTSVEVFHPQQFTATVSGVSNTAVTWSVDQIQGGNSAVGQIDSTGNYLAPNSVPQGSAVTITAISQADSSQSASEIITVVPDARPPAIISVSPSPGQKGIALDGSIRIQFSDVLDPATVGASTFTLNVGSKVVSATVIYEPGTDTVTIQPTQLLIPGTEYTVTVSSTVSDPAGTPLGAPSQWSFTAEPPTTASGVVSAPPGTSPASLSVLSYGGQEAVPDSQGNFSASIVPIGTSLVAAMVPGRSFGWLAIAGDLSQATNAAAVTQVKQALSVRQNVPAAAIPVHITRYQITASPMASSSPSSLVIDATTTAEALLFMSPYLYRSDPTSAAIIEAAITADPNTTVLAAALNAAANEPDPLSDSAVQSDMITAIVSITASLNQSAPHPQVTSWAAESANVTRVVKFNTAVQQSSTTPATILQTTPPCWNWTSSHMSTVAPGQLQCLDLDYLNLESSGSALNGQFSVDVSSQNCAGNEAGVFPGFYTGCDVDWLVLAGPINSQVLAAGGPSAISAGQGSNGPSSPFGAMQSCSSLAGSCKLLVLPGQSTFSALDPRVGFGIIVQNDLNLPSPPEPLTSFQFSASTQGTYVMRGYSGGIGDSVELQAINSGFYEPDSQSLWESALAINVSHIVIDDNLGDLVSDGDSPAINQCAWQDLADTGQLTQLEAQISGQQFDSLSDTEASITADVGMLATEYKNAALSCGLDTAVGDLWDFATKANAILEAANKALEGLAMVGDAGQRIYELWQVASPIETGVINVEQPNSTSPVIIGMTPNPIQGLDGSQPVMIVGSGFAAGAMIHWKDVTTGQNGTAIPTSVTAGNISGNMNFSSHSASWEIQIVNPDGTTSNWWTFPVTASTAAKPDLVPSQIALSTGSVVGGGTVTVTFTVTNEGTGPAAASTTGFRLGTSATVPPGSSADLPSSFIATPALLSGASLTQNQAVTIPSGTVGTYYLWVVVDDVANSNLGQSNTTNDYAPSPAISITAGASPAPTPISPGTVTDTGFLVTTSTPTMQWSGSGSSVQYELMISQYPYDASSVVYDSGSLPAGSGSFVVPGGYLQSGARYRWNMRAIGSNNWSSPLYFTVETASSGSGSANVTPRSWSPVFTAGGAPATLGFDITNQSIGTLTGTISAATTSGGQWLTVNGHASDNWVTPVTEEVTANPTGLGAGTYSGTVTVSTSSNSTTVPVNMTIYDALQITTTSLPDAVSGQPYSLQLQASGGTGVGYTWTLVSGALPLGISFTQAGLLSGTAGSLSGSTTESLRFAVRDSIGHQALSTLALVWRQALVVLPYSPSNFQFVVGTPYTAGNSIMFQAAGGTAPYTWSATGLPIGLSIGSSSGLISGIPTQSGNFSAPITVHDSVGNSNSQTFTLPVIVSPLAGC